MSEQTRRFPERPAAVDPTPADDDHLGSHWTGPYHPARQGSLSIIDRALANPAGRHVYIDISRYEAAKYTQSWSVEITPATQDCHGLLTLSLRRQTKPQPFLRSAGVRG